MFLENYKFFLLFLSFHVVFGVYVFASILGVFLANGMDFFGGEGPSGVLSLIDLIMGLITSLSALFLVVYHWWLSANNLTTYEHSFNASVNVFDVGKSHNLKQIFGDNPLLWLLPVFSSKLVGVEFPRNDLREELLGD